MRRSPQISSTSNLFKRIRTATVPKALARFLTLTLFLRVYMSFNVFSQFSDPNCCCLLVNRLHKGYFQNNFEEAELWEMFLLRNWDWKYTPATNYILVNERTDNFVTSRQCDFTGFLAFWPPLTKTGWFPRLQALLWLDFDALS